MCLPGRCPSTRLLEQQQLVLLLLPQPSAVVPVGRQAPVPLALELQVLTGQSDAWQARAAWQLPSVQQQQQQQLLLCHSSVR